MISTGTIRAVNPVSLAHASGVTKIPRFAAPVTPVIRPDLLTTQLMGCCPVCAGGDHDGPIGLTGFIPPDYGTLRNGGSWGLFKMASSGHGLGKGASGTHAADHNTRSWSFGLRGLGQAGNVTILGTIGAGGSTFPGVGTASGSTVSTLQQMIDKLTAWLGLGAGRREADVIVPVQNNMVAQLGTVTNQFLAGSGATVATLQQLYTQVWILAVGFQEFVLQKVFTDRRASGQALNTVMPYFDGSCGYAVPLGATATPSQQNCLTWGAGTLGGAGTNGMLGALGRAIVGAGGTAPVLMDLHQAANSGIPPTMAATVNPVTGTTAASIQSALISAGLPATIGGINTSTWLLIALGAFAISRMR